MIINKAAKDMDMAAAAAEKKAKEIQGSYNSKYKSWLAVLKLLQRLEKHNYHGRLRLFGRFGSVVQGASSPKNKHETLLYSLNTLKHKDFIRSDISRAEGDFVKVPPYEIESKIKEILFKEEITSVVFGIGLTIQSPIDKEELFTALDVFTTHSIKFEKIEGTEKDYLMIIYTLDEEDLGPIAEAVKEVTPIINKEALEEKALTTTLLEVLIELFKDVYGETPTFLVRKEPKIVDYLKSLTAQLKPSPTKGRKTFDSTPSPEKEPPSDIELVDELVNGILTRQKDLLASIIVAEEKMSELREIDIDEVLDKLETETKEESDKTNTIIKETEDKLKTTQAEIKNARTWLEATSEGEKEYLYSKPIETWTKEYKKKVEAGTIDPEHPKVGERTPYGAATDKLDQLLVIDKQLQKVLDEAKAKAERLKKLDIREERKETQSDMEDNLNEQEENLAKLKDRLVKMKEELFLPKREIVWSHEGKERVSREPKPKPKSKQGGSTTISGPDKLFGKDYATYMTNLTTYQQAISKIGQKIEVEMSEMDTYITENKKKLQEATNYFKDEIEESKGKVIEDMSDIASLPVILALQKVSLTDTDLEEMQKLVEIALKAKRELKQILRLGKGDDGK